MIVPAGGGRFYAQGVGDQGRRLAGGDRPGDHATGYTSSPTARYAFPPGRMFGDVGSVARTVEMSLRSRPTQSITAARSVDQFRMRRPDVGLEGNLMAYIWVIVVVVAVVGLVLLGLA